MNNVHTNTTVTNVAGQALVPVIVSAREGLLDREAYDSVHASPVDDVPADEPRRAPVPA